MTKYDIYAFVLIFVFRQKRDKKSPYYYVVLKFFAFFPDPDLEMRAKNYEVTPPPRPFKERSEIL